MGVIGRARAWQRDYSRRLLITDSVIVVLTTFGSQALWFGVRQTDLHVQPTGRVDFTIGYTSISVLICLCWMLALSFYSTRDPKIVGTGTTEYKRIADATLRLFGLIAIAMYLSRSELGRGYLLTSLPLGLIILLLGRWCWRKWLARQRQDGNYLHRALLVGERKKSQHVVDSFSRHADSGIVLIGALTKLGSTSRDLMKGVPVLGGYGTVLEAIDESGADTVIFTGADDLDPRMLRELGWSLEDRNVGLIVSPALTDIAGPRIHARPVAGLPLIHVEYPKFEGHRHVAKRAFDMVASGLGLIVLSPLLVTLAILVRTGSEGPALFLQDRIGANGRQFKMFKFRSMVSDAEAQLHSLLDQSEGNGVLFKMKDDPRVTPLGKFLRRYSLDELPQLLNVLKGDMSLVGPRPPLAAEVELYDGWARRRLLVKPGITGLWQVSGRSDLSWEDSVRLDLYYVENWSLTGDFVILWRTGRAVLRSSGAY